MDFSTSILGIELGSTRIKGVLIDENHQVIASGSYGWENDLTDGVWTYRLEDAIAGVRTNAQDRPLEEQKIASITVDTHGETYPEPNKLPDPYGRF